MTTQPPAALKAGPRWPWVVLGVGLVWTALIRVPLIVNAEDHLDSDLAVDGLTLLDALGGHWRWHFPGTPFMGILPMLASYPQALAWGASAVTLVSGGTIIWLGVTAATFWLAWRAYSSAVAGWAILPLVFSSIGTIWLSGRITGGHLLTLVWHTLAFVGLHICLTRGGWPRFMMLGIWCGLGLYLDAMFLFTLGGLIPAALWPWLAGAKSRRDLALAAVFLVGLGFGLVPRAIGRRVDRHDAYPSQFDATFASGVLLDHARLLGLHCLPRLIAGGELFELEESADPGLPPPEEWLAVLLLAGLAAAIVRLVRDPGSPGDGARKAVGRGVVISALLIAIAFLVNNNIFDSDNYRYLIFFLPPWSLGFGLLMRDLTRLGRLPWLAAVLCAGLLIAGMTTAAMRWYRDDRHYVSGQGIPIRRRTGPWRALVIETPASPRSTSAIGTYTIPPDVTHVFGGYWDVYRLSFLSGGRITGIPFPIYPNRFRGWSRGLSPTEGKLLVLRPDGESRSRSRQLAGRSQGSRRPAPVSVPIQGDWVEPLATVWKEDGRDPAELKRLQVVVPSPMPARR
jgi:hypothetical protein